MLAEVKGRQPLDTSDQHRERLLGLVVLLAKGIGKGTDVANSESEK